VGKTLEKFENENEYNINLRELQGRAYEQAANKRSRMNTTLREFLEAVRPDFEERDDAHLLFVARRLWIGVQALKANRANTSVV